MGFQSSQPLAYSDGPFNWQLTLTILNYRASKDHGNADALSRLPRKTIEEADDWSIEGDQVNRVQIERTPITATRIRQVTRGDPVLPRVLHYVLHGWPAEENTPEEFRFYRTKREEFTVEDGCLLRGTRVVIPSRYRQEVMSELHLNNPGMVPNEVFGTIACLVA